MVTKSRWKQSVTEHVWYWCLLYTNIVISGMVAARGASGLRSSMLLLLLATLAAIAPLTVEAPLASAVGWGGSTASSSSSSIARSLDKAATALLTWHLGRVVVGFCPILKTLTLVTLNLKRLIILVIVMRVVVVVVQDVLIVLWRVRVRVIRVGALFDNKVSTGILDYLLPLCPDFLILDLRGTPLNSIN